MTEAIPPWYCPAAVRVIGGGSGDVKARLANPEKSGDAKPRNYGADLTAVRRRYVRRAASKPRETVGRKGKGPSPWYPRNGSPPAGSLCIRRKAKKGRLS